MDRNDKVFYVLIKSLCIKKCLTIYTLMKIRIYTLLLHSKRLLRNKLEGMVSYLRTNEDINNGPAKKITDRKRLWLYPAARNKGFTLVDNDNVLVLG